MITALTEETNVVGRCHAPGCKAVRYGSKQVPPIGYYSTVEVVYEEGSDVWSHTLALFACTRTHLAKAEAAALADPAGFGGTQTCYSEEDPDGRTRVQGAELSTAQTAGEQANNATSA
jgi:hypothetical protein